MSFSSGVAGGIFLPILVQGAILGALFSKFVWSRIFVNIYNIINGRVLNCCGKRSPLTSIILIFEMTQNYLISYL